MADPQPSESTNTSDLSGESSGPTVQLNIKTLDSRIYSFHVNKNIVVSAFKEKIASQSGVPIGQQRLIFRGKVLKDNHLLSEYNVENGDTLHLVERQPQGSSGSGSGEAASSNGARGQDPAAGGSRNRIGHIAHSVVLGTLNVGDPGGEAVVPDLNRVIGAVLNSIGIGNLAGTPQPGFQSSNGNGTEGSQANAGSQSQGGGQPIPWQIPIGQSPSPAMQIPLGAAITVPPLNMPIPDSLHTLTEFMNRMEHAFSESGDQPIESPASGSPTELPTNSRGLPTVEALCIVLRHAERLLREHAGPSLTHAAGRLDEDGVSTDPTVRRQVQTDSMRLGVTMQHLGALLLELGRTILTLRMGQSPAESFVNAGPAVYISPLGPNPIMVQPFPLQTSTLFGGPPGVASNPVPIGPVGVGSIPRNVNIHIHTGASLAPIAATIGSRAPNGEGTGTRGQGANGTDAVASGQARSVSGVNATTATTIPPPPAVFSIPSGVQPGAAVPQAADPNAISSIVAEINAQLRSMVPDLQNDNHAVSGQAEASANQEQPADRGAGDGDSSILSSGVAETSQSPPASAVVDDQKAQPECEVPYDIKAIRGVTNTHTETSISSAGDSHGRSITSDPARNPESLSRSSQGEDTHGASSSAPLGLGLGGLQPKRRNKLPRAQPKNSDGASGSSHKEQSTAVGQKVLQSLASLSATQGNTNPSLGQSQDLPRTVPAPGLNADGPIDAADAMSQVLQSPALDGLLSGVSQQTGVGSPDMLRNMLQQFTQNPAMRNVVNQMAQQIDSHDLGSMFSGLERGPGGGFDLSGMMQQMMPIVSQALGGGSAVTQRSPPMESVLRGTRSGTGVGPTNDEPQIDLRQVVQRLENQAPPEEVFSALIDRAAHLSSESSASRSLNELSNQGGLAQEFMEMLHRDISQRLHDEKGS